MRLHFRRAKIFPPIRRFVKILALQFSIIRSLFILLIEIGASCREGETIGNKAERRVAGHSSYSWNSCQSSAISTMRRRGGVRRREGDSISARGGQGKNSCNVPVTLRHFTHSPGHSVTSRDTACRALGRGRRSSLFDTSRTCDLSNGAIRTLDTLVIPTQLPV